MSPWLYADENDRKEWNAEIDETVPCVSVQLYPASMTIICGYGFYSSSSGGVDFFDNYHVYADFEGEIPRVPVCRDDSGKGVDPVGISERDYPQQLIFNSYEYREQVNTAMARRDGKFSPDGSVFAWEPEGGLNPLDMSANGLLADYGVMLHWTEQSRPDEIIRGFSSSDSDVIGLINNRYLVEVDLYGLHVYDLQLKKIVYRQPVDIDTQDRNLHMDRKNRRILNGENKVQFTYSLHKPGKIQLREAPGNKP